MNKLKTQVQQGKIGLTIIVEIIKIHRHTLQPEQLIPRALDKVVAVLVLFLTAAIAADQHTHTHTFCLCMYLDCILCLQCEVPP